MLPCLALESYFENNYLSAKYYRTPAQEVLPGCQCWDALGVCPFVSVPVLLVLLVLSLPADGSAFLACSVSECEGQLDNYLVVLKDVQ